MSSCLSRISRIHVPPAPSPASPSSTPSCSSQSDATFRGLSPVPCVSPRDAHRNLAAVGNERRSKSSMGKGERRASSGVPSELPSGASGDRFVDDESARGSVAVASHLPGRTVTVRDLAGKRRAARSVARNCARARRDAGSTPREPSCTPRRARSAAGVVIARAYPPRLRSASVQRCETWR